MLNLNLHQLTLSFDRRAIQALVPSNNTMPFLSYPDVYYENLCDGLYQPQEYEVVEDNGNQYINKLISMSSTTIANVPQVKSVYEKEIEYGLFKLFYTDNLRDNILQWTNTYCDRTGKTQVTKNDLEFGHFHRPRNGHGIE